MECVKNCRLCDRFILSQAINFDTTTNTLIVDLPSGSYGNCQKYCIVLAQTIPASTTINAQVVFSIGGGVTQYPFLNCDCTPILASQIRTRRIYQTRVNTAVNTGVFKYIGKCCLPSNSTNQVQAIPIPTTTATASATVSTTSTTNLVETSSKTK